MNMSKMRSSRFPRLASMLLFALITVFAITGCSRDERAYQEAKSRDSIESWTDLVQRYPNSVHAEEARERIKHFEQIQSALKVFEGKDAVAKTKAILQLQKMPKDALPVELVPALIAALSDNTSVQISENAFGADVRLNTQLGRGSVLRMQEGDIFPSDTGVVIAGNNAILKVSTPEDEARAVLVKMAGENFGTDVAKWNEWWVQYRKKE